MISLEEARGRVLASCAPLPAAAIPIDDALGCVLAEAVVSTVDVPAFANTAMDGFAVRAADVTDAPTELTIVATLAAGTDPRGLHVGEGEAIRIMTGAPIPAGADAVVMVELTATEGDTVTIEKSVEVGNHIRPPGQDTAAHQEVFAAGTTLTPGHLGVLASIGLTQVVVHGRPRVGVLSTGDELRDGPGELQPGQIRDANRHALLALVREAGAAAIDLGLVRDDESAVEDALQRGVEGCDLLITSGGVSMGDFDYVKAVLERRSGGLAWMQVAIRPAKPLAFGVIDGTPIFGLPGNPVSAMVSFELFARPAIRQLMGHAAGDLDRPRVKAIADEGFSRRPDGRLMLARVVATLADDGRYHVRSAGGQESHMLRAMAHANALALVPDGDGIAAGAFVDALLLS